MGKKYKINRKIFSGVEYLPRGKASDVITEGCIVLEGGAFRGVYTEGVLDALMQADINMRSVVGVSAGALNGMYYVAGQIGRPARINLTYRHDPRYVGLPAVGNNGGLIGFDFLFHRCKKVEPFDAERFWNAPRRLVAVATNCNTGRAAYLEKDKCDILRAIQASASMPCFSRMVWVEGAPYLDGGCSDSIPYRWALKQKYRKILVVRTRPEDYRKGPISEIEKAFYKGIYHRYPRFLKTLEMRGEHYNRQCEELKQLKKEGRIYMVSPAKSMNIGRLEPDMEKLGAWYYQGYQETRMQIDKIKRYLESEESDNRCHEE